MNSGQLEAHMSGAKHLKRLAKQKKQSKATDEKSETNSVIRIRERLLVAIKNHDSVALSEAIELAKDNKMETDVARCDKILLGWKNCAGLSGYALQRAVDEGSALLKFGALGPPPVPLITDPLAALGPPPVPYIAPQQQQQPCRDMAAPLENQAMKTTTADGTKQPKKKRLRANPR